METRFRFTNERIRALPANPPEAKSTDLECSDTEVVGLKCLSGRTGQKRFLLRYRTLDGQKRSLTLGRFPTLDVNAARKLARKHLVAISEGEDPRANREALKEQPTLSEFFWKVHLPLTQSRNRSWKNDAQRFRDLIEPKLDGVRYKDLTVDQVQHLQQNRLSIFTRMPDTDYCNFALRDLVTYFILPNKKPPNFFRLKVK